MCDFKKMKKKKFYISYRIACQCIQFTKRTFMPTESRRDRTNPHNLFKMGLSGLHPITENLHLEIS